MAEALDKLKVDEELKKTELKELKEIKQQKRNLKRRKWVDWKTEDKESENGESKRAAFDPAERVKRRKSVIVLGYSGADYYGMQRNPGMSTIEEELFKAMLKHKWITDDSFEQAQNAQFQRAARTDKGVSAARQVCSMKLPESLDIPALNADLPEVIRLFAVTRVTKGFNAKDQCNARTYTYTVPTIAFGKHEETHDFNEFRIDAIQLQKIKDVLKNYEGTKNYHNFTSKKNAFDPSAKRYIMSFECSEPFLSSHNIEFVTLKVKGQSFMLHQIRKMVGVVMAIVRGNTTASLMDKALSDERICLPTAPGLGLVLDTVHYERYNDRYGNDGIHEKLVWEEKNDEIKEFCEKYIYANIYEKEYLERPILEWLETLAMFSYDRTDETNNDDDKKTNANDKDDNEE